MDEWDVLKARARAQCVTVKERLWCDMALVFGEAARAMERAAFPMRSATVDLAKLREERKIATAIEMLRRDTERAERRAAKAAKQAAREERKRMRREEIGEPVLTDEGWSRVAARNGDLCRRRWDLAQARERLIDARVRVPRWENGICYARDDVREAELRYAIACAEAGAVPGGRVH